MGIPNGKVLSDVIGLPSGENNLAEWDGPVELDYLAEWEYQAKRNYLAEWGRMGFLSRKGSPAGMGLPGGKILYGGQGLRS